MNAEGDRLAIGAQYNDGSMSNRGHVRIYEWNGTLWTQLGQDIDGEAAMIILEAFCFHECCRRSGSYWCAHNDGNGITLVM